MVGDGDVEEKKRKEKSASLPRTTYKSVFDPDKKVDPATCGAAVSAQHQLTGLNSCRLIISFFFSPLAAN